MERLILCEREVLVDWLVLNGFHAEQRALVMAESGYPHYLLPMANEALQRNPRLPVFLLHDSTRQGVGMAKRVQDSECFALAQHPVTDLGLLRSDVEKLKRLWAIRPERQDYEIPVDSIPLRKLSVGLAGAMAAGAGLGVIIDQAHASAGDAVGGDFG